MFAVTSRLCFWICVVVITCSQRHASADQINIAAESGQNITLTCRAPNNNNMLNVDWSRADLGDEYVLLYRDGHFDSANQHPSFKNRVDLQDRQMKDGDVSLILKDVTTADSGTYECRVFRMGTNRGKRAQLDGEHINTIVLGVVPPGPSGGGTSEDGGKEEDRRMKDRSIRPVIGLCVFGVFVAVVCFLIHRRHKEPSQDSNQPPAEQQQVQMLQLNHESPAPLPSDLSSDRK